MSSTPVPTSIVGYVEAVMDVCTVKSLLPLSDSDVNQELYFEFVLYRHEVLGARTRSMRSVMTTDDVTIVESVMVLAFRGPRVRWVGGPIGVMMDGAPGIRDDVPYNGANLVSRCLMSVPPRGEVVLETVVPVG